LRLPQCNPGQHFRGVLPVVYERVPLAAVHLKEPVVIRPLVILEPDLPKKNLRRLYSDKESFRWIEQESRKLMGLIGPQYEQMAATGGTVINDLYGNIPDLGWDRMVDTFLHTEKV
jgi:hypothetical protein